MDELIALLRFLAAAGSGLIAAQLISWARGHWPRPARAALAAMPAAARIAYTLLHAPRYARLLSLALAGAIGLVASLALAGLQGEDARPILDAALAALASQIRHGLTLSPLVTEPDR
jgi:hypothetical protein